MGNTISYEDKPVELDLGDRGAIRGIRRDNKSHRYTGVPYALPPTGKNRWRKPLPLPSSYKYDDGNGGPYDATKFKALCPQKAFHVGDSEGGKGAYSEDCLFVNIWTPVPSQAEDSKKWPVMLWFHGGWFQMGDPSHEPVMESTELVSTGKMNAIIVAIGYRLNVFGFLAGSALLEESDGASAGNFGLWDQRLAAEWVKENIHYFGGDPDNITVAGRSAGAYSAEAQMLYDFRKAGPRTKLYSRIFMDSNAIPAQPKSISDVEDQFDELCENFGLDKALSPKEKLGLLREKSALELVMAIPKLKNHTFRPVTDDLFIHSGMPEYLASKEFADEFSSRGFKILIGEVLNEETLYSKYNSPTEPTLDQMRLQVSNYYSPEVMERVLKCYDLPKSDDLDEWQLKFGQIISDGQVRAPSRLLVKNLVDNGVGIESIWRYLIAYRLSFIDESVAPMSFGVAHAMDKPVWSFSIGLGPTQRERSFMEDWIKILVAFVHDDSTFSLGTKTVEDLKVAAPDAGIEVQRDERWDDLLRIGRVFNGEV